MSAHGALGRQFVTLYHGTRASNVDSIKREGLHRNMHVIGAWPTLTTNRDQAMRYANDQEPAVITVRTQRSNLTHPVEHTAYGFEGAKAYGLLHDIPPEHIRG